MFHKFIQYSLIRLIDSKICGKLLDERHFSIFCVNLAQNVSNKKITRLSSDIELTDCEEHANRLTNRNPRNLEQMSLAMKPNGYWLDRAPSLHWNRIEFESKGKYLYASLVQWNGNKLLSASTLEPNLLRYLKSTNTAEAAITLAQVFARRCLQSGYLYAQPDPQQQTVDYHNDDEKKATSGGHKRKVFFESLQQAGLSLQEPPQIMPRSRSDV